MEKKLYILLFILPLVSTSPLKIKVITNGNGGDMFEDLFRNIRSIIESEPIPSINENTTTKPQNTFFTKEKFVDFFSNNSKIEGNGNEMMKRDELSDVACTVKSDCNATSYCHKLSYTCNTCHQEEEKCTQNYECCTGYTCDEEKRACKKQKGQSGDKCESADDCSRDHCCTLNDNGDGICRPYLKDGQDCGADNLSPFFFQGGVSLEETLTGLPSKCPCQPGLQCKKKESFFFFESEKCSKPLEMTKTRSSTIHITIKKPLTHYHNEKDLQLFGYLFPHEEKKKEEKSKSLVFGRSDNPMTFHRFHQTFRIPLFTSIKRLHLGQQHKQHRFPLMDLLKHSMGENNKFDHGITSNKFGHGTNANNDDSHLLNVIKEDEVGLHKNIKSKKSKKEMKAFAEHMRKATHNAIDSMFSSMMNGIVQSFNNDA